MTFQQRRLALSLLFLACLATSVAASAQNERQDGPHEKELENRARMEIRLEEDRQKDLRENFVELQQAVKDFTWRWTTAPAGTPQLTNADQKELKKIEKLAKKIRDTQGGDDDEAFEKGLPDTFTDQVKLMAQSTEELRAELKKSSRHLVSVGIITRAHRIAVLAKMLMGKK